MRRRILLVALVVGLLASLGLNITLLRGRGARASGKVEQPAPSPVAEGLGLTGSTPCPERGAAVVCKARLRQCQRRGLEAVVRAGGAVQPATSGSEEAAEVDLELQSSVLCDVAKRRLKEGWHRRRERIIAKVLRDLQDANKQRRDLEREVEGFASTLGLDSGQRGQLRTRYAAARGRRITAIAAALGHRPADLETTLRQVKGLFADEDRIVGALFGEDARRQLRASQLEQRTTLLAIAAAMGGRPWDHTIAW